MLKKILVVAVCLTILGVLAGLSVMHYNTYKVMKADEQKDATKEHMAEITKVRKEYNEQYMALGKLYESAVQQCQFGVQAYAQVSQTARTKLGLTEPKCPPVVR